MSISGLGPAMLEALDQGPYYWRLNTALALTCHMPEQRIHAAEDLFVLEKDSLQPL